MRNAFLIAGLAGGLMTAGHAFAGVTIVSERGDGTPSTLYLDGMRLRMERPERNEHAQVIIIDAATKRQVMIDEGNKTYVEITEEDRKRMHAQADAMRAQTQDRLKDMPPDRRKRMAEAMGGAGARKHDWKFEAMGPKKTINGFACDMYRVFDDGQAREEICASPWGAGVVKKQDFAGLAKFGEEMMDDMRGGKNAGSGQGLFGRFENAPGIPISRVPLEADGKRGQEEQIKSIKRGPLPASLFEIPAGFTKKDFPMGMGPGMGPGGHHAGPGPR